MQGYSIIEKKGDIVFYRESLTGKLVQEVKFLNGTTKIIPVKSGLLVNMPMYRINGYTVAYNKNGVYGYCIKKGSILYEDNIWSLEEACNKARLM